MYFIKSFKAESTAIIYHFPYRHTPPPPRPQSPIWLPVLAVGSTQMWSAEVARLVLFMSTYQKGRRRAQHGVTWTQGLVRQLGTVESRG